MSTPDHAFSRANYVARSISSSTFQGQAMPRAYKGLPLVPPAAPIMLCCFRKLRTRRRTRGEYGCSTYRPQEAMRPEA